MTRLETLTDSSIDAHLRPQSSSIPSQDNSIGIRELRDGARAWEGKPKTQFAEEVASLCMETKRIPDPYFYTIREDGKLLSPVTGKLVEEVILRDSKVGELEFQAFDSIQKIVKGKKSGVIAWVSPPEAGAYSVSKIIVSEIREQDGKQILFNRAIVLDIKEAKCLEFARGLANYSHNKPYFSSNDEVRSIPLELSDNCDWTYILEELLPDISLKQVRQVRNGEDLILKQQTVNQALDIYQQTAADTGRVNVEKFVNIAGRSGMVGNRGSSCPPKANTAFNVFAGNSQEVSTGCEKVRCRKCGWEPGPDEEKRMERGELTSCPGRIKGEDGEDRVCGWSPGQAA
ncbi:MAG: hypothetical protein WCV81_00075 [Microgenomates group bacterium]|jgi:hypothetical protein